MASWRFLVEPPEGARRPPGAGRSGAVLLGGAAFVLVASWFVAMWILWTDEHGGAGALLLTPLLVMSMTGTSLVLLVGAGLALLRGERGMALLLGGINGFGSLWTLGFLTEVASLSPVVFLGGVVGALQLLAFVLVLWCFLGPWARRGSADA